MSTFDLAFQATEAPSMTNMDRPSFWRKDPPVLVDGQVVQGGMWAPQRRWWDLPNFVKMFVAGYGGGKTYVGSKRIIASALNNAPCPVAVVSPSFRVARHTTVSTITELLAGKRSRFGRAFWFRFNRSLWEFRIRFRGREGLIIIYSGEDPQSLIGPNLASAWIDEPFVQDEAVFKQMIARVRHPDAFKREILLTGTPEAMNWGFDLAVGEWKDRMDVGVIQASTRENLTLGDWYVKQLQGAFDGKAAEAYIEGQFVNLAKGQVYHAFDSKRNVAELPVPSGAELWAGMDFNVNPMAFCVGWRAGSHMHVMAEYEEANSDTEYCCELLRERWVYGRADKGLPVLRNVYPDASGSARKTAAPGGRSDFWYIEAAEFSVEAPHANPKRRDRYNAVNSKLKAADGRTTFTIDPRCKKMIKYLSLYNHENINKPEQKAMSHLLDAMSYPVVYLFPPPYGYTRPARLLT